MRPLIEILEDERTLMLKLEGVCRYFLKNDDPEVIDVLIAQKERVERDIDRVRMELNEYIVDLLG